ncbi:MAG: PhoH family protein, partial [Deltaproteobacteria bacterium]|nr:PhoH family protein [Deltaproteobacteria bacterium]
MKKTYVLDTNVVLHDPLAVYKFEDNAVVLPIFVIEEVDQFKKELSELGQNARHLSRILDELRNQNGRTLDQGVPLESTGGELRVAVPPEMPKRARGPGEMDRFILQMALDLRDQSPDEPLIFVTMDTNLRIRADALGLKAETYEGGRVSIDELYSGVITADVGRGLVDQLAKREPIDASALDLELSPNAGIVLREHDHPRHTALGRFDPKSE